ncbi:hypothetical protein ILUMI_03296 [Ignelater luminosus]|uniref:DDE Tnp4 domain-containing protein n=1 Tax=Ignelater luminosus TaxID=2038154 RepID=A0A8K0DEX4_IGNLU|nr:hypothetical protein ILUMI_03296 [Ignelater luminosus]
MLNEIVKVLDERSFRLSCRMIAVIIRFELYNVSEWYDLKLSLNEIDGNFVSLLFENEFEAEPNFMLLFRLTPELARDVCNRLGPFLQTKRSAAIPPTIKILSALFFYAHGSYQKSVIGVIDCMHIAIVAFPAEDEEFPDRLFINRKDYHSINCQGICNADIKILAINERYSGSVHDAAIWSIYEHNRINMEKDHGGY